MRGYVIINKKKLTKELMLGLCLVNKGIDTLGTRTGAGIQLGCYVRNKKGIGDNTGCMYRRQGHCGSYDPLSCAILPDRGLTDSSCTDKDISVVEVLSNDLSIIIFYEF